MHAQSVYHDTVRQFLEFLTEYCIQVSNLSIHEQYKARKPLSRLNVIWIPSALQAATSKV